MCGCPQWTYLSPHLDDAVLSCGGLIWQQIQNGFHIEIWTIFAGDQPAGDLTPFAQSLHDRWQSGQNSAATRRLEDAKACRILKAEYRHFDYPDCIYRLDDTGQAVISREEDLFQPEYKGETALAQNLAERLARELPQETVLVIPYGFGAHIDHQLVRHSAEMLRHCKWLYADYPYSAVVAGNLLKWLNLPGNSYQLPIDKIGLNKWQEAVAAYATQLNTFWPSPDDMQQKIADYCLTGAGSLLYQD
ncbi:MAG: PIG-L family deacetylase [Chloroflexi bacterium]|nr:PIG-L family deacetylase [Chloroflexota bacterium]